MGTGTKSGSRVVKVCDRVVVFARSAGHNDARLPFCLY